MPNLPSDNMFNRFRPRRLPRLLEQTGVDVKAGNDLVEGLFASSRAVDGKIIFPSYGNSLMSQIARLGRNKIITDGSPTNIGLTITPPAAVELTATYQGVIDPAGQLPLVLTPVVEYLGDDVASDPRTTYDVTVVNATHTVGAGGVVTVTGVSGKNASVSWKVFFGGQEQLTVSTAINVVAADAPPTSRPFLLSPLVSTIYTMCGSIGNVSAGDTRVSSAISYNIVSGALSEIVTVTAQLWRRVAGGSWEPFGPEFAGTAAYIQTFSEDLDFGSRPIYRVVESAPGSLIFTHDFVLPAGIWEIAIFAKLSYNSAVSFVGSPVLEEL